MLDQLPVLGLAGINLHRRRLAADILGLIDPVRLAALRSTGESNSDVIIRLAKGQPPSGRLGGPYS